MPTRPAARPCRAMLTSETMNAGKHTTVGLTGSTCDLETKLLSWNCGSSCIKVASLDHADYTSDRQEQGNEDSELICLDILRLPLLSLSQGRDLISVVSLAGRKALPAPAPCSRWCMLLRALITNFPSTLLLLSDGVCQGQGKLRKCARL